MKFKHLLTKTLLVAVGLLGGVNLAWGDTETVTVLSENYESYAAGDITSTMQTNGWTFQTKQNKNEVTIVQGAAEAVNATKYFDFYYPDGGANRNQSWNFGTSASLNADNWKLTFSAALNPGINNSANKFYIVGTKSGQVTSPYNDVTNYLLALKGTAAAAVTYTPSIGSTTYDETITLENGTWYKFLIEATGVDEEKNTATIHVKITSYNGATTVLEKTIEDMDMSAIGTLQGICWNSPRGNSRLNLDDVLLTKEVDASICADPTFTKTGTSGTSRKFTLACETAGSTVYYATSNLEKGADGWETYTSEVTTSATTIYAYAEKGSTTSNIVNFSTGAGTEIQLNAPTVSIDNLIANGSYYNARFGASYNSAGVEFTPSATLSATFTPEGGSASSVALPYTATQKGTLTITSSSEGFASAQTVIPVAALYEQSWQSLDFSSLIGIDAVQAALGNDWTQQDGHDRWAGWSKAKDGSYNFYQHGSASASTITINDKISMREVVLLAEGMGLGRNVNGSEPISVISSEGEIVAFEIYNGYGDDINKGVNTYKSYGLNTSANPSMSSSNGALLVQATIFSPVTFALSDGDAVRLTFDNAGGAFKNNWMIDFYAGDTKVANVRADWWDGPDAPDPAGSGAGFTYPYTYSSDGGATPGTGDVWGSFATDMADADIDLTLSYASGTLYVTGTMTRDNMVYFVNYKKEGLSGDLTYNLYGYNATLSNIAIADATPVTTAAAHPDHVTVAIGANGYATYANNLYPLDLTSAPAYKAAIAGDKVNFTAFGQAVPANTGMLLEGTASGTVDLPIADEGAAVSDNAFEVNIGGSTFTPAASTTYYGMMKDMTPLTFGTFDPSAVAIPANKAYLAVSGAGASRLTAVFGEATGINAIDSAKEADSYYNLNGQRVAAPVKGLYFVNGKKVLVK